jgi:hypothetical protein
METVHALPIPAALEGARAIADELAEARRLLASLSERLDATAALAAGHRDLSELAEPLRQAQAVARSAVSRHVSQALMTAERRLRELEGRAPEGRAPEARTLVRRPA